MYMLEKVLRTTQNYTKISGMIICNRGEQENEVRKLLTTNNYKIEISKHKGGTIQIKYNKKEEY